MENAGTLPGAADAAPFADLLPAPLAKALTGRGYTALTAVQAAVIEPEALGRDLVVSARTGSGKTVAFGLAMGMELLADGQLPPAGAPLALAAPVAAIALGASPALAPLVFLCALLGGLVFAFVGGIGAALSLGARRGGLLTAVIVLPLFTPPVIFGGGALDAYASGLPWQGGLALLGWRARRKA